ncbi:MAG TPA: hypothetical protein VMV46_20835 [Thermoanaerobaculia bacterium]|nr:hypothetical protein [Thermoanaerobaculia bacterium]
MSEQRQKQVLAVLLAVLAVVVAWKTFSSLEGAGSMFGGVPNVDLASALGTEVADLDLARLQRDSGEYRAGRNPWRFEAPPAPPPVVRPTPAPLPAPVVVETPVEVAPIEPPKPQPPPIDVELRGILGPERLRLAVFHDGEVIYNAGVGDVVKGKFRVEDIQIESVLVGYVGFPDAPPARLPIRGGVR